MKSVVKSKLAPLWLGAFALAAATVSPAYAALDATSIRLSAPGGIIGDSTPLSLVNTPIASGDGVKASPGDGTAIGGYLLPLESISFSGNDIDITIAAGAVDASNNVVTGYLGQGSQHAQYVFDGLTADGLSIKSFTAQVTGGGLNSPSSLSGVVTLVTPDQLTINLDNLIFKDLGQGQSNDHVSLQIALTPVPEPTTLSSFGLAGLIMTGLVLVRRRAQR